MESSSQMPMTSTTLLLLTTLEGNGSLLTTLTNNSSSSSGGDGGGGGRLELGGGRDVIQITFAALAVLVVMVTAVLGNLAVITAVAKDRHLREEQASLFIVNLCITDLSTSLVVMLSSLTSIVADRWVFGSFWCGFVCAANYCCIIVSMLTLCFISIDRYVAILHALHYHQYMTRRVILALIAYAWFQGLAFCIPPVLTGWVDYDYWEMVCAIEWFRERAQALYYVIVAFLLCFLVPGLGLAVSYCKVLREVRKSAASTAPAIVPPSHHQGGTAAQEESGRSRPKYSSSSKAVISLLIVVVAYFVCMTPFSVTKLYKVSVDARDAVPGYANMLASIVGYVSSAVNPLIYGLLRKDFQRAFRSLLRGTLLESTIINRSTSNVINSNTMY